MFKAKNKKLTPTQRFEPVTRRLPRSFSKRPLGTVLVAVVLVAVNGMLILRLQTSYAAVTPPPSGGYFQLKPAGSFASLPSDAEAAAMVTRSAWEPRPENKIMNATVPPSTFKVDGYGGMINAPALFGRVTGNFTGTTDEIIQWTAAKWGLPDDVIRAEAVAESYWYQSLKDANGNPVASKGYGDFGDCGGSPEPSGYGAGGPASFGLMQIKWCTVKDANAAGYGPWPWSETSTAYNLDFYSAIIRGCIEGWDSWLSNGYKAGDLWGCVGRWYSGEWYSAAANNYISVVQGHLNTKPWRTWPDMSTVTPTPTAKQGDVDGDNDVDALDLSKILARYGSVQRARTEGDLNGDGRVNGLDLSQVLTNYGK